MKTILTFIRNWTLPLSMIVGFIGYRYLSYLAPIMPFLVFSMLLLTFCRVPFSSLRFKIEHFWLLLIQIGGAILAYYVTAPFNVLVAEGALICMMTPTATAAPVITEKLGGSASSLTSFTVLSNLGTAITAPLFFPIVHHQYADLDFFYAFFLIFRRVFPLLVLPFICAELLRRFVPPVHKKMADLHDLPFYLWSVALTLVTAQTINSLFQSDTENITNLLIALGAFITCCLQFGLGKWIGHFYGERITGGQALGQKNTILGIWMAYTFMTPITAIASGSYVLWQNIINSWQLWYFRKREESGRPIQKDKTYGL